MFDAAQSPTPTNANDGRDDNYYTGAGNDTGYPPQPQSEANVGEEMMLFTSENYDIL